MAKVNSWLLINLGCEMLYIIDQRLNAQSIEKDKAAQGKNVEGLKFFKSYLIILNLKNILVLRDVTNALLSPNFFTYVATTFSDEIISLAQARILLTDIACCSLMRLDVHSLDKLIDLMIMIFKWQFFLISKPDDLLGLTLRHLHGVCRLMPEKSKMIIIDQANQYLYGSWSELNEEQKFSIVRKLNKFLAPHNVRISLLIRMRLQQRDGSFMDKLAASTNDFYCYYSRNNGENIYEKVNHFPHCQVKIDKSEGSKNQIATQEIDFLFRQFNADLPSYAVGCEKQEDEISQTSSAPAVEQNSTLDDLKKKCKLEITAPQEVTLDDNFQELLNMQLTLK